MCFPKVLQRLRHRLGVRSDRDSTTGWTVGKGRTYDRYHRKVRTQGQQLPPETVGRKVLRSSLHLQQVAARCTSQRDAVFKMQGKEADMTGLRVIGARAFVHVEAQTTKMGTKLGKGSYADSVPTAVLPHAQRRKGNRRGKPERHVHRNSTRCSANARRRDTP